jgi:hypothetical protein
MRFEDSRASWRDFSERSEAMLAVPGRWDNLAFGENVLTSIQEAQSPSHDITVHILDLYFFLVGFLLSFAQSI